MGIPGLGEDALPAKRRSGYEDVVSDIHKPAKAAAAGKSRWHAALLQLLFGYVGAGYFYLEEARRGALSAAVFIGGALAVVCLEMAVFPSDVQVNYGLMYLHYLAVALFLALFIIVYPASVYDCYRIGLSSEKRRGGRRAGDAGLQRKPTPQELFERAVGEHDRDSL